MKITIYNDFSSSTLFMVMTFLVGYIIYLAFPISIWILAIMLVNFYSRIIDREKNSNWFRRSKTLPISISKIYFGKTLSLFLYWLYILIIVSFFQLMAKGFNLNSFFGTVSFSRSTFLHLILNHINAFSFVLILFSIDMYINFGGISKEAKPFITGMTLIFVIINIMILFFARGFVSFPFIEIRELRGNYALITAILLTLSLGLNGLLNFILIRKEYS